VKLAALGLHSSQPAQAVGLLVAVIASPFARMQPPTACMTHPSTSTHTHTHTNQSHTNNSQVVAAGRNLNGSQGGLPRPPGLYDGGGGQQGAAPREEEGGDLIHAAIVGEVRHLLFGVGGGWGVGVGGGV